MAASPRGPGRALARERKAWLREQAQAQLKRLRVAIIEARRRRRAALLKARRSCAKARVKASVAARDFRSRELARINTQAAEIRNAARAQCQARRHRIGQAGLRAIERKVKELRAEDELQRRLRHADRIVHRHRTSAKVRQQESDDAVRGNLPRELLPVFERVKRAIKGSARRTRTEEFLEWAQEHPEDVLEYQGDATDAEVKRLVREYEAAERQLRKATPRQKRRASGSDVPF